ncbi:uncharacterized protein LOC114515540 isoform X2 [Dendronephthya gigantea]|nr:uncharacterized protein LOC114515540 isoform X2 [Dendronephthya gigantea]XP_028390615.1 uncharacterized protein LOC114515540 isoform X2 [Dendronephthya gigantea]
MSVLNRRRSRFHSLCDDNDGGKAVSNSPQCRFIVSYIGETVWREEFTYVNEVVENILPKQMFAKFWSKKDTKRKVCLFVDVCSTAIHIQNTQGISENSFRLCDIKEVIYCGHMKQYSKYLILVVNGEVDSAVNAHIFSCASVKDAKNAFKIFTDLFTSFHKEKPDFHLQVESDITEVSNGVHTSSPYLLLATEGETERQNSLSESEQMSPDGEEHLLDHEFTAFARIRSFNSGRGNRYTPGSSKKRPYSLPARNPR